MHSIRSLSRHQGAFARLLGLVPHGGTAAVEDVLTGPAAAPLAEIPRLLSNMVSRSAGFTSAAAWETAEPSDDRDDGEDEDLAFELIEGEETVLALPTDLKELGHINPELRRVMEAHAEHARSTTSSARKQLEVLLAEAAGGKQLNLNKTNLNRLRVDQVRQQLADMSADTRGTKAVLVQRLLQLVEGGERMQAVAEAAEGLGDGVVSRRDLGRQAKLLAQRRGPSAAHAGISQAELLSLQEAAVVEAAAYARVFEDPHDVARLLSDARADDVAIVDVRGHCNFADYMVLATGRSHQIVRMLAQGVLHELKQRCREVAPGVAPAIEGAADAEADWLVVDAGSVVVHVFSEEARREYNLEGLWGRGGNVTRVAPKATVQTLHTMQA